MPKNRIKELRAQRGLSSEALAEKVNISQGHMSRIETGTRGLSVPLAERIAMALETDAQTVLGLNGGGPARKAPEAAGLSEDAEPYKPRPEDFLAPARDRDNVDPWRVTSDALDHMGIRKGDIILVDVSAEAVEGVKPLQAVVAQIYDDSSGSLKATTVLRQFVPPSLLITNSSTANAVPLDRDKDDVAIKGVVVGIHRSLRV